MACVHDPRASQKRDVNTDGLISELPGRTITRCIGIRRRTFPYKMKGVIIPVEWLAFRSEITDVG